RIVGLTVSTLVVASIGSTLMARRGGPSGVPAGPNLRRTVTVEIAEKTKDAVVYISTKRIVNQRISPFGEDFFSDAFPQFQQTRRLNVTSLGSGFIVHPDGYVVTN